MNPEATQAVLELVHLARIAQMDHNDGCACQMCEALASYDTASVVADTIPWIADPYGKRYGIGKAGGPAFFFLAKRPESTQLEFQSDVNLVINALNAYRNPEFQGPNQARDAPYMVSIADRARVTNATTRA